MDTEISRLAAELAKRVMDLDAEAREAVLSAERDEGVREAARRMVAQAQERTLVGGNPAPAPFPAVSGAKRIGAYTLVDILGEGGMGIVYLAKQERPSRMVALKVIRPGAMTPRMLRRFELESQMLARLQHPGIAQIYEAATADTGGGPQPFFAMEHVRGVPLTQYAKQRELSIESRLELFTKVCEAVQHAHQQGVIHRDLKPSNILVDGSGQPKVLDFGVARATDDDLATVTCHTEIGQLVGTVPYMSPEQIAGDARNLDTRSDVYTLGVILYELLAGKLPHAVNEKTLPEASRMIREDEPAALASVDRALAGDVQTIVSKAMEKEKQRRYQSAADLAADIQRFLSDEPILARPASRGYILRKFVARNRALVAGATFAALALCTGSIATAWQAVRAMEGQRLAEERGLEALRARAAARSEADNANAVSEFLSGMLAAANPDEGHGTDYSLGQVLDAASRQLDAKPPASGGVALILHRTLSDTYRSLGRTQEALAHARQAVAIAGSLAGEEGIDNVVQAERSLAMALSDVAQLEEAERVAKGCVERLTAVKGEQGVETAKARGDLARILFQKGQFEAAEEMLRGCLAVLRPALGDTHADVLTNMDHLGNALNQLGRFGEAETQLREALAIRERVYGPTSTVTAFSLNNVANSVQKQGRNAEAAELLSKALAIRLANLPKDHPSTLITMANLAVAYASSGQLDKAEPLLRESMLAQERALGEAHPKTLSAMGNLAYVLEDQEKLDEAEALFRRVVEIRRRTGMSDPEAWPQMNNLAMLLMKRGKVQEAQPLFEEILQLCGQHLPKDHYTTAIFRNNYGECLTRLERFEAAERELLASQEQLTAFFKEGHPRVQKGLKRLAGLYHAWNRPERAAEYEAKVVER